jgi:hypothetical protein
MFSPLPLVSTPRQDLSLHFYYNRPRQLDTQICCNKHSHHNSLELYDQELEIWQGQYGWLILFFKKRCQQGWILTVDQILPHLSHDVCSIKPTHYFWIVHKHCGKERGLQLFNKTLLWLKISWISKGRNVKENYHFQDSLTKIKDRIWYPYLTTMRIVLYFHKLNASLLLKEQLSFHMKLVWQNSLEKSILQSHSF